ncbi:DsrE/DsrF/TusD sulfur relay family protein [Teredinibacter franksiae]|uniref:DsrE/DsrF/TusD sulfur relay family protein n=1 Tax=Teredinibacter franksiae TaxID=2761453 RepID=UPI00162392CE|nr:DsrE family protein [Teredinibacter franksiae]
MKYLIVVNAPPGSVSSAQALAFANALLNKQHTIETLFFVDEGVKNAEDHPWAQFLRERQLTATICVNSVEAYLPDYSSNAHNPFQIAGMAQLAAALASCDRTLTFGSRTDQGAAT